MLTSYPSLYTTQTLQNMLNVMQYRILQHRYTASLYNCMLETMGLPTSELFWRIGQCASIWLDNASIIYQPKATDCSFIALRFGTNLKVFQPLFR